MPGPQADGPTDAETLELARTILERPEYRKFDPEAYSWLREGIDWLLERLQWLRGLQAEDPGLFWLILAGLFVFCLLLVAHVVYTLVRAMRAPSAPNEEGPAPRARADLAAEASALAERGQHLEAAHRMWLATLRTLAERRVIALRPQDANHVVRARLREASLPGPLYQQMLELIQRTEMRWFGTAQTLEQAVEDDARLYASWQTVLRAVQRLEPRP